MDKIGANKMLRMKRILLAFSLSFSGFLLSGQSIAPVGSPFQNGADLVFEYSGAPGNATDWIGVYPPGEVPDGSPPSLTWNYITSPSGTFTLPGTLPNGDYDVHLFCCDGYDILASATFSVTGAAPASLSVTTYPVEGQPITFEYAGGSGDPTDWIGIYNVDDVPGTDGSLAFQYVPGPEGSLAFDDPSVLVPGNYKAYLFCCDGYVVYASTAFTIYEALQPSLAPVGALTNSAPITFAFTGGTGALTDWVGIYPHDTIPDGNPPSLAFEYVTGANGEVTFPVLSELVEGELYDAHLFCCDGYERIYSIDTLTQDTIYASYLGWTVTLTSTGELQLAKNLFTAYPTPAQDVVYLEFAEPVNGDVNFYNVAGQFVRSFRVAGDKKIEVRGLPPGVYAARLWSDKGSQTIKVLIE